MRFRQRLEKESAFPTARSLDPPERAPKFKATKKAKNYEKTNFLSLTMGPHGADPGGSLRQWPRPEGERGSHVAVQTRAEPITLSAGVQDVLDMALAHVGDEVIIPF